MQISSDCDWSTIGERFETHHYQTVFWSFSIAWCNWWILRRCRWRTSSTLLQRERARPSANPISLHPRLRSTFVLRKIRRTVGVDDDDSMTCLSPSICSNLSRRNWAVYRVCPCDADKVGWRSHADCTWHTEHTGRCPCSNTRAWCTLTKLNLVELKLRVILVVRMKRRSWISSLIQAGSEAV